MATQTLKFKLTVNAPPAEVYRAFTNSTALRQWMCDAAQADASKGGRLYLWWRAGYYACGEFTSLSPNKKLAFTWRGRGEPDATRVQVSLAAKEGQTVVTLSHLGLGSGKKWASAAHELRRGWEQVMENLQSVLETGQDLRYTRLPMLGINTAGFDANIAAELGVPVSAGMRLGGAVEGMGAHAAGLQKDDVIVSLGGKKVVDGPTYLVAMRGRHAGDKVKVVFYRGSAKKSVSLQLSGRPLPQIPPAAGDLANALRKIYAECFAKLEESLVNVTEVEAARPPSPNDWSALQTLAHLIISEYETHVQITDHINDDERWSDGQQNPTNVPARVNALVAAHVSLKGLLEELGRSQAQTVAMVEALPAEVIARKRTYWLLARDLQLAPYHLDDHLAQIQTAIQAARHT